MTEGARTMIYSRSKKAAPETLVRHLASKFRYYSEDQWGAVIRDSYRLVEKDEGSGPHASSSTPSNNIGTSILANIDKPRVYVNEQLATDPHRILQQQDRLSFVAPPALEPPVDEQVTLLYDDPLMVVVCKSGNIPVCEGGRYRHNTLIRVVRDMLRRKIETAAAPPSLGSLEEVSSSSHHRSVSNTNNISGSPTVRQSENSVTLFPVHRLDKETSGIVVFAKSKAMAAALGRLFAEKGEESQSDNEENGVDGGEKGLAEVNEKAVVSRKAKRPRSSDKTGQIDDRLGSVAYMSVSQYATFEHDETQSKHLRHHHSLDNNNDDKNDIPSPSARPFCAQKIEKHYLAMVAVQQPAGGNAIIDSPTFGQPLWIDYRIGFEGEGSSLRCSPSVNSTAALASTNASVETLPKRSLSDRMKMKCYPTSKQPVGQGTTLCTSSAPSIKGTDPPHPSHSEDTPKLLGKPSLTVATCRSLSTPVMVGLQQAGELASDQKHFYTIHSGSSRPLSFAILAVRIFTGRSHQIRVHLAGVGLPIIGDKLYCSASRISDTTIANKSEEGFIWPPPLPNPSLDRTVEDSCFLARARGDEEVLIGTLQEVGESDTVASPKMSESKDASTFSSPFFVQCNEALDPSKPLRLAATRHCLHAARLIIPLQGLRELLLYAGHEIPSDSPAKYYLEYDRLVIDASQLAKGFSDVFKVSQ